MNDEEKQKLMASFVEKINNEAAARKKEVELRKKEAETVREKGPTGDRGSITVDGKSLGRAIAATEEKEGDIYIGRNPEDVVIGKRENWK